jgi:hypothetical protein
MRLSQGNSSCDLISKITRVLKVVHKNSCPIKSLASENLHTGKPAENYITYSDMG